MSPRGVAQCGPSLEPADDVFVREVCSLPFFVGVVRQTDVVNRSFQSRTCHFFRMESESASMFSNVLQVLSLMSGYFFLEYKQHLVSLES